MRYRFIAREKKAYPVTVLCRVMRVSTSGFYDYQKRQQTPADAEHEALVALVKRIAKSSGFTYGTRRMARALTVLGHPMGRHRARSLMREAGVQVIYRKRYRATTNSRHRHPVYGNVLARNFAAERPNQAWVSDITYLWTHQGWLYLTVILDLYSRRVVGWSMGSRITAELVCDALRMAVGNRQPSAGLIFHSDQGVQYASHAMRRQLRRLGMIGSMSRRGDCWDNAVAESFFGTLKTERVKWRRYLTRDEARRDVVSYINMHYNSNRLHSYLNYRSPIQFELANQPAIVA